VVEENHRAATQSGQPGNLQQALVLRVTEERLGGRLSPDEGQALLTAWYDLFRTGYLSWGFNLSNPNPPFCHVTDQGRRALANLSRDPSNPDGYSAHLATQGALNPVALTYVDEALRTYNSECFRASAVMIGAAAESVALQLRDVIVEAIKSTGRTLPKDLESFLIKRVLDALGKELEMQQRDMPTDLLEPFQAFWSAFVQQIRAARNDAGHPARVDAITPERVHAALLVFPELVGMTARLLAWVPTHYSSTA
jgi:hypothetical protein